MFRTLMYPSSGACDCVVELPHQLSCSQFVVCWRFGAAGFEWCLFCRLTTSVVIQQHSCKLLMMDILMSETCWAHKKWNKIASNIKLVFHSATITMMHGPINIRLLLYVCYSLSCLKHSCVSPVFLYPVLYILALSLHLPLHFTAHCLFTLFMFGAPREILLSTPLCCSHHEVLTGSWTSDCFPCYLLLNPGPIPFKAVFLNRWAAAQ